MKVSVVLPTWNRANRIAGAIRSIIDQSYENWELIVLDDGSTDGTERIVKNFAHPRVKYHKIDHQNNISRVRNIGNKLATGDIIVVQDSDDLSFPDRLEWIVDAFQNNPTAEVVYHGIYLSFIDPYNGAIIRKVRHAEQFDRDRLKKEQYIPGQIAYLKKTWEEIPYNEDIVLMDDFAFLVELAYSGKEFYRLNRNLYEYISSPDSVNVSGEMDGRRREDVKKLIDVLKNKYGVEAHATLTKQSEGRVFEQETI